MQQYFWSAWGIGGLFQGSWEVVGLQREASFQGTHSPDLNEIICDLHQSVRTCLLFPSCRLSFKLWKRRGSVSSHVQLLQSFLMCCFHLKNMKHLLVQVLKQKFRPAKMVSSKKTCKEAATQPQVLEQPSRNSCWGCRKLNFHGWKVSFTIKTKI